MGDTTREDGPDNDADIIDLSKFKAKKESADIKNPEPVPGTKADLISTGRDMTRGRALKMVRLKPHRSGLSLAKSGPAKFTIDEAIRKNKRRARLLAESKTAKIDGLHPIQNTPVKSITGGEVTEVQPQTLVDDNNTKKLRGQEKLFPVSLLHMEEYQYIEDRISIEEAVEDLSAIAVRIREEAPVKALRSKPVISPALFDEVALVLLKMTGTFFNGYLNDLRVESCCRMVLWDEPKAKIRYNLTFISNTPVS